MDVGNYAQNYAQNKNARVFGLQTFYPNLWIFGKFSTKNQNDEKNEHTRVFILGIILSIITYIHGGKKSEHNFLVYGGTIPKLHFEHNFCNLPP